jgi:predicted Rossmann-fold nucleotide-binding protein
VVTGGGVRIMEAANLAPHDRGAIGEALALLARVPAYPAHEAEHVAAALEVRERFAPGGEALAVASWIYPDEPISQFASHIAKYFQNSIREDGLLSVATCGVIYLQGGFGTLQEVFQHAEQNETPAYGGAVPMIFVGEQYAEANPRSPVHVLRARTPAWGHLMQVADTPADAVALIRAVERERAS